MSWLLLWTDFYKLFSYSTRRIWIPYKISHKCGAPVLSGNTVFEIQTLYFCIRRGSHNINFLHKIINWLVQTWELFKLSFKHFIKKVTCYRSSQKLLQLWRACLSNWKVAALWFLCQPRWGSVKDSPQGKILVYILVNVDLITTKVGGLLRCQI